MGFKGEFDFRAGLVVGAEGRSRGTAGRSMVGESVKLSCTEDDGGCCRFDEPEEDD